MPDDLLAEAQELAANAHLSVQDVCRQTIRIGLPELRKRLADAVLDAKLAAIPDMSEESKAAMAAPDPEFDAIYAALAKYQ